MIPQTLAEKLFALAQLGKLGHFYLLSGRGTDQDAQKKWVAEFIRRYWSVIEKRSVIPQNIQSDADLLWIQTPLNDDDEIRDYRVEDFHDLFSFLGYRGISSKRRFVIIESVELLSEIVANKLLKSLEEPEGELTYFLLNPTGAKMLATIESRAIQLPLAWPRSGHGTPKLDELKQKFASGLPLADFLDDAKKNFSLNELLEECLIFEQQHDGPASLKQELLTLTRSRLKSEVFHQGQGATLQWLHTYLSQRFRAGR